MKRKKIRLTAFDLRLVIRAVSEFRNAILAQNCPTDDVDRILLMLIDKYEK